MSHKNHPNMKTTFEKLMVQAVALREEHTQTHGGVFDIYEFAKEYGVTRINRTGDDIIIRASDDTHKSWECDIPAYSPEEAQRFTLAMLTGWVVLRGENSPSEFMVNNPTSRVGGYDSLEEMDAELFAYALMVPDKALTDASITSLYNTTSSQRFMDAVSGVKDSIATELGVPPMIVENYAGLRWALYQAKKQDDLRNEQREASEAARRSRLDTYSSSSRTRRRNKWSY